MFGRKCSTDAAEDNTQEADTDIFLSLIGAARIVAARLTHALIIVGSAYKIAGRIAGIVHRTGTEQSDH